MSWVIKTKVILVSWRGDTLKLVGMVLQILNITTAVKQKDTESWQLCGKSSRLQWYHLNSRETDIYRTVSWQLDYKRISLIGR
jgi:hypothetical protein